MKNFSNKNSGLILVNVIVFGAIATILITSLIVWFSATISGARNLVDREQSFQIAEAGIDYYRWHLAHAPNDFQNGTAATGPYVIDFIDKDGNTIGNFTLTITPPTVGSTKVKVVSEGVLNTNQNAKRTIEADFAVPSFAKFAFAGNDAMRFGQGTEIFGPIMSNNGIRFDGIAHNIVSSALASYDDPDHSGAVEFGVHTHVNPAPGSGVDDSFRVNEAPNAVVQNRTDVFMAGREFPVPAVDFSGITADIASMKTLAQSGGVYLAPSAAQGYDIVFKTNNTFDVYRITSLRAMPSQCTNTSGQANWGTWSINAETFVANYAVPANGIIFVEDNTWVRGQINGSRATVVAGALPDNTSTRKSITINTNLLYTNYDGTDVLGLIAQRDVNVGLYSDDTLRIDAALIAQNGRVGRYFYPTTSGSETCSPYHSRSTLTLYGMIASNQRYGFAYTGGSGYATRNIIYDANLMYGPPPSFPLTSDQYQMVSWKEVK